MKISLTYAVYQNEGSLRELYDRSVAAMEKNFPDAEFEFIFVNDGSRDNSLQKLIEIKKFTGDGRIKIVNLSRNFGQLAAVMAGWREATGDAILNLAADLQDPPEQCVPMVQAWLEGNDVVISYRRSHGTSWFKKLTSRLAYRLFLPSAPKGGFDFALLSRKALEAVLSSKQRNRCYQYDLLWVGFDVKFIPYDKQTRRHGKSQFTFLKRWNAFLRKYINASYAPLRAMSFIGFAFALAGGVYAIIIVRGWFLHRTPFEGWAPIMILLLVVGGMIMVMLGVLGEYIWRILDEVKGRPMYVVKEIL